MCEGIDPAPLFAAGNLNSIFFFHAYDFTNFGYYMQLSLSRTAAGGNTSIARVRLR